MVSQILIRVDKELKDKFQRLSRTEQKSVNEKVRELMEEYVRDHNMEAAMRSLWDEIGQSLRCGNCASPGNAAFDRNWVVPTVRTFPTFNIFHPRALLNNLAHPGLNLLSLTQSASPI